MESKYGTDEVLCIHTYHTSMHIGKGRLNNLKFIVFVMKIIRLFQSFLSLFLFFFFPRCRMCEINEHLF